MTSKYYESRLAYIKDFVERKASLTMLADTTIAKDLKDVFNHQPNQVVKRVQ